MRRRRNEEAALGASKRSRRAGRGESGERGGSLAERVRPGDGRGQLSQRSRGVACRQTLPALLSNDERRPRASTTGSKSPRNY